MLCIPNEFELISRMLFNIVLLYVMLDNLNLLMIHCQKRKTVTLIDQNVHKS